MWILLTASLLLAAALALLVLRAVRPQFRFAWLIAVGAAFVSFLSVILWRPLLPLSMSFGAWLSGDLLASAPSLAADTFSWVYAVCVAALALASLLTAVVREEFPDPLELAVCLALCALGLLAVTAANPLTLALVWAALDLVELTAVMGAARPGGGRERIMAAFSAHALAIVLLLLAQVSSASAERPAVDFSSITPRAGVLLLAAAALRLGVLPVHLPYELGAGLRRGIGTSLRLVSAAAGLVLLSHVPVQTFPSLIAILILVFSAAATLYAGWMWLRAPEELAGRPFWVIGMAGLALFAGFRGDAAGATAWGAALILSGAALFLYSAQRMWLTRSLLIGAWAASALPFSLTAIGWRSNGGILDLAFPLFLVAQVLLMAGLVRHALRSGARLSLLSQPAWSRSVYPAGILLLLAMALLLGLWGWPGALQPGSIWPGLLASLLTAAVVWAVPRLRVLNPVPAHWLQPSSASRWAWVTGGLRGLYGWLRGVSLGASAVLEGEAGLMWTLLLLLLFIVMMVQRTP